VPPTLNSFLLLLHHLNSFVVYSGSATKARNVTSSITDSIICGLPINPQKCLSIDNPPQCILAVQLKEDFEGVKKNTFGVSKLIKELRKALLCKPESTKLTFMVVHFGIEGKELCKFKTIKNEKGQIVATYIPPGTVLSYTRRQRKTSAGTKIEQLQLGVDVDIVILNSCGVCSLLGKQNYDLFTSNDLQNYLINETLGVVD